ncbi:TPA: hypothetical protein U8207_000398 [Pseudomonas putida]|nr:hypothetical protein [Pseudomonas putida]
MGGDDYVIDEARGKAWNSQAEAISWYQAELSRLESKLEDAWDAGWSHACNNGDSYGDEHFKARLKEFIDSVIAERT